MSDAASAEQPEPEQGPQTGPPPEQMPRAWLDDHGGGSVLAAGFGKPVPTVPRRSARCRVLRFTALTAAVALTAGAAAAWMLYEDLDGNIRTDTATERTLSQIPDGRPGPAAGGAQNILLLGSDKEAGTGSERSDTTMLLHLSADRTSAALMSVPRDLLVQVPSCRRPSGGRTRPQRVQFNWAYGLGGPACTILTFEKLTGIRVDHHVVVDFSGFKQIVDAAGGVTLEVDVPVYDPESGVRLKPGTQRLDGAKALVYVRTRLGVGDGSDTQRMGRQQRFMRALMDKIMDSGTLKDPARIYPLLRAVTSSMTADPGLNSIKELYTLVDRATAIDSTDTNFLILPRRSSRIDHERDELAQPDARRLFERLRKDQDINS
ncbi:LCP family protein [Streptomyces sp. NPDC005181]|uniref:LCP family protein n=1 Tax=Streptomyces sp. NPDC005181 TaxID=3156869 RepID=UPI0033B9D9F4